MKREKECGEGGEAGRTGRGRKDGRRKSEEGERESRGEEEGHEGREGGGREPRLCPAVSPTEPRTTKNWPDFCEHLRKVRAYISHRFGEEVKSGEI